MNRSTTATAAAALRFTPVRVLAARPAGNRALLAAGLGALLLAGCGKGGGSPAGSMPPPQVNVLRITPRTVAVPYEFPGRVEGSREVEVRARVSGILLEQTYDEGAPVQKGQLLFLIDPAPYRAEVQAAEAALAEVKARLSRAERDLARLEPLLAARAASRKDRDNAASDTEQARAAMQSAQARLDQAKLDLSYTRVTAPTAGLSSRAVHSEGSLVSPGENGLLTHISRVQPIWVRFSASDQSQLALRRGIAAGTLRSPPTDQLEVELVLPDGSLHPEHGRVNFSDSQIDPATGSVALRAELSNATGVLIPGQFLRVRLLGIERPDAILVPQRAVQQGREGKFVFVVGADGKAEARTVQVGEWLGQDWVIESGLKAGERVVIEGTVKVQPGGPVTVVDAGATPQASPAGASAPASRN